MAGSHRVLVTRAVGLVELTVVLSLRTSGHHRPDAGTDRGLDGRTVRTLIALFDFAGQEWFANWDGGEVTVDVTAGTRRPAPPPPPPSCAPPKLSAVDGDQRRRRRRRRILQAVAAVLVPLVAFQLIVPFHWDPRFRSCILR